MQQAKEAAKDVAVKKEASLPTNFNLEEMAGQGQEFVTARDTKLPILKILYANSPVLDESDGKYIESAKQGDIYNETSGNKGEKYNFLSMQHIILTVKQMIQKMKEIEQSYRSIALLILSELLWSLWG